MNNGRRRELCVGTTVLPAPHDVIGIALLERLNLPRHLACVLCDGHHLDRHMTVDRVLLCAVDFAKGALAELFEQQEVRGGVGFFEGCRPWRE